MKIGTNQVTRWLLMAAVVVVGAQLFMYVAGMVGLADWLSGFTVWNINIGTLVLGAASLGVYDYFTKK